MVPKRELICVLPYFSKTSVDLRTRLRCTIEGTLPYCKLKVIFRCRLQTFFTSKIQFGKYLLWNNLLLYGVVTARLLRQETRQETFCHFYTRTAERMGISNLTGKRHKNVKQSAISDHLLQCNCTINFDDFDILVADSNKFKLLLRQSLSLKRDTPILKSHFRKSCFVKIAILFLL